MKGARHSSAHSRVTTSTFSSNPRHQFVKSSAVERLTLADAVISFPVESLELGSALSSGSGDRKRTEKLCSSRPCEESTTRIPSGYYWVRAATVDPPRV
jgi:hypothetical protein